MRRFSRLDSLSVSEYCVATMSTDSTTKPPRRVLRVKPHSSLRAWRRAMGLTQRQAAAQLGISQSYYYKLEAKTQTPRKGILKTVTARTGVPVDELMGIAV